MSSRSQNNHGVSHALPYHFVYDIVLHSYKVLTLLKRRSNTLVANQCLGLEAGSRTARL